MVARRAAIVLAAASLSTAVATGPALAAPPANPFAPLPAQPQPAPTQAAPPVQTINPTGTTASGGGLSGADAVAIGVGALVILGGISFFIWWDARRRAPVRRRAAAAAAGGGSSPGSKRPPKPRKLSQAERKRRKRGRAR